MPRPLRILYAAGPGDVIDTYRHWRAGRDDPSQVSMTYSGQFYDVVKQIGAHAHVIASHPRREKLQDGNFTIEHRPIPLQTASGALYHLGQIWSAIRLLWRAILFRAKVLIVVDGTAHWFALRPARWLGIRVIPTIHCVFWPKAHEPRGVRKLINKLNRKFFHRTTPAIMSASHDISQQVTQIAKNQQKPIHEFLPTYRPDQFAGVTDPPPSRTPFKVLFAGRIERNKGVFDLLEIAKRFDRDNHHHIEFDLCGTGAALADLRGAVEHSNLATRFRLHGHCDKPTMRRMFSDSHVVIVPTTTGFLEGFNQVVAEGVLSGRPVITSSVCPALDYVKGAVVEVPPDNVEAYANAILKLRDNPALYEQKVAACKAAQPQFYDPRKSWGTTFLDVLRELGLADADATTTDPRAPRLAGPLAGRGLTAR
jgi:glycosyltransferase involved in cell wall biosynthesis